MSSSSQSGTLQYRNEERAALGKGPYRISPRFKALENPESKWATLTHQQRMSMLEKFKNAGMDSAKSLVDESIGKQELQSTLKLLIEPENSSINACLSNNVRKGQVFITEERSHSSQTWCY